MFVLSLRSLTEPLLEGHASSQVVVSIYYYYYQRSLLIQKGNYKIDFTTYLPPRPRPLPREAAPAQSMPVVDEVVDDVGELEK